MAVKTVIEALREGLWEEMKRDERVIVLGEDIGIQGGVFRLTDGFVQEFGEERVIDTPLAESLIVGAAIGAAMNGLKPVAEIQFADFIYPAVDQIINEAAKIRYRSTSNYSCPIVVRAPYGGGIHGGLYHSQSLEALFSHIAGLKVVAPSTPYDAKGLIKAAVRDVDPVIFLEHKKTYRLIKGEVPEGDYVVPLGKADVKRQGKNITVVAYGLMLHYSLEAAEAVSRDGIDVEVVDLRTLRPLDKETLLSSVKKTGKVIIVHEDSKFGGFGAELSATIAEEAFDYLDGPIVRVTAPDVPAMPYSPPLEDYCMPSPEKIAGAIRQLAAY
ncbi:MAG: alpha-ketoacid dehydrogenase subunit beta [Chloroflexi bacterium]|nr:alpha-ketoacid dehydrogenase subunit beta [Chloroflexota bacterium]